jgi:hypothetical protein
MHRHGLNLNGFSRWRARPTDLASVNPRCALNVRAGVRWQNPFKMPRDFFDPSPEQQNVVLIDAATLRKAERLIESCEGCNPFGAGIPFDNILDRVTGSDPSATDYVLEEPAKCPNCRREILEKTLVEPV